MTTELEGDEGTASRPGRSLSPGKTRYPLYRRLGGRQGRSGLVREILPPPGLYPRTVQPLASRCTDYTTRHTIRKFQKFSEKTQILRDQCAYSVLKILESGKKLVGLANEYTWCGEVARGWSLFVWNFNAKKVKWTYRGIGKVQTSVSQTLCPCTPFDFEKYPSILTSLFT
jgi:hypothetical protein